MRIDASGLDFRELNARIRNSEGDIIVDNVYGQRFIGTGESGRKITVCGVPGNALGAYLDGSEIVVSGNSQDAVGDTMNSGLITIYGDAGDALGYSMRGGKIFVRGNSGYRTGIHMKQYKEKKPVIIVGGKAGSFLGEYLAGGLIIVLGMNSSDVPVGNFTGTGMHGGTIFVRYGEALQKLPSQVLQSEATDEDLEEIMPDLRQYADTFGLEMEDILSVKFQKLTPNAKNPYKQLYTEN